MRPFTVIATSIGLLLACLFADVFRRQWLLDVKLADGVRVVQTPFEREYAIRVSGGSAIKDPFGWIIRPNCIYGSYGDISYFFIRLGDLKTTRPLSLGELNEILRERGLPRYHMNDEENISHLKYDGGRNRKYR